MKYKNENVCSDMSNEKIWKNRRQPIKEEEEDEEEKEKKKKEEEEERVYWKRRRGRE